MGRVHTPTRPTLRCLRDDLPHGWGAVEDQRLVQGDAALSKAPYLLDHVLVRKAVDDFPLEEDVDKRRESVSGLTNPPFWKVKADRWRGAVYVDDQGQPWLVAGGLRYEREGKDFYKLFMTEVRRHGPEKFLPSEEDCELLRSELTELRILHRETAIHELARQLLREAASAEDSTACAELHFTDESVVGSVTILVARPDEVADPFEILVEIDVKDWAKLPLIEWDEQVLLAAICAREDRWGTTVTSTRLHSLEVATEEEFNAMCDGDNGASQPGCMVPGVHAHTVHRQRLTEATVQGDPVRAVCGRWFVPRQDHDNLPRCGTCEVLARLLGIDQQSDVH